MTDAPGLLWNQIDDNYTRLGSLEGLSHIDAIAACNSLAPWSQMRRLNLLDDGNIGAICGGVNSCYSDTDVETRGQCMVNIENFEYYTDFTTEGVYIWYIRPKGGDETVEGEDVTFKTFPAFIRNGVTKDRIFPSAFEGYVNTELSSIYGGDVLESKAGVQPTSSHTIAQFRAAAHARNGGAAGKWEIMDYLTMCAVQWLYLIKYGGSNSQTLLGAGVTNITDDVNKIENRAINTGATASLGNTSGTVTVEHYLTGESTVQTSFNGIESFYGNIQKFVDGINLDSTYSPWIADHGFTSVFTGSPIPALSTPYVNSNLTVSPTHGYITDIATDPTYDFGFLAKTVSSDPKSVLKYICDSHNVSTLGNRPVRMGGGWHSNLSAGTFEFYADKTSAVSDREIGARLMYVG